MSETLTLESFAKVNRSLLVLGKRPDGFHELDTLFATIDLCDRLSFRRSARTVLTCSEPELSTGPDNLVIRAVHRVQELYGIHDGLEIHLEKRIPWGAGLGGGSSNAAVTLMAAASLLLPDTPFEALPAIALELGSDVPFFLVGGRARGKGRGERLSPLEDTADEPLLLVVPPFRLSTPAVFRTLRAEGFVEETPVAELPDQNDLEAPAAELEPGIRDCLEALRRSGARQARMSGSGSCLFGVFDTPESAGEALSRLRSWLPACRILATRTVGRAEYRRRAVP